MRPHIGAKKLVAATAVLGAAAASVVVMTSGAAQASEAYGYSGYSHGTYVYSGLANSGPQVSSFFGCTRNEKIVKENKSATAKAGKDTLAHSVRTITYTHNDNRGDGTTSEGYAADIKLGPELEITGVKSYSSAVAKNGEFLTTAGTKIAGIRIGGVKLPSLIDIAPNTRLTVPGIGYIVLNRVWFEKDANSASAASAAVLIHSTVKNAYLSKGASIAVLLTKATVGDAPKSVLRGKAYESRVRVGELVKSDGTSLQTARCFGTGGKTVNDSVAQIKIPGLLDVRGASTRQNGLITPQVTRGTMRAETAGVDLGTGKNAVHIGAVMATASASRTADGKLSSSWNTSILSIRVGGKVIPVPKAPNQKMDVLGLGTITFNKVVKQQGFASVTAIEIYLRALDTTVEIAHAESGIVV